MADDLAIRIGQRIRQRRRELNLTQKQVAARMASEAVDGQRISDWERAYNAPSGRYITELVTALDVPDVSYFYEAPEKPKETLLDVLADGDGTQLDRIEAQLAAVRSELARLSELMTARAQEELEDLLEAQAAAAAAPESKPGDSRATGINGTPD